ncbi:MAG: uracil-DNA glycosylase [Oscillospiraceae bacterium]|nr:uracil-DNA glycosylase [Oscillospiraceae bacterium]
MVVIGNDWDEVIGGEFSKDYYLKLRDFLKTEYSSGTIYPDMYHIYTALKLTPYHSVKVVIFGQDPYHEPGQAHGLCFSVQNGTALPPSLRNIYKELETDLGIPPAETGDLTSWAEQGVLLLNTVLTVRRGQANSHKGKGWEILTDEIIRKLNERENPMVFILWGANARSKKALITNPQHLIIESAHPSPLSAGGGFFGSRPFSRTNQFLAENGEVPINWEVGK